MENIICNDREKTIIVKKEAAEMLDNDLELLLEIGKAANSIDCKTSVSNGDLVMRFQNAAIYLFAVWAITGE